jgi:hypothetical protein
VSTKIIEVSALGAWIDAVGLYESMTYSVFKSASRRSLKIVEFFDANCPPNGEVRR